MIRKIFILLTLLSMSGSVYANDKLTVLLDWFANPSHAPLFVAKQQGYFDQEKLDVDLLGPADPSDPPKLVAAGRADVAITYEPQFMEQVDQGLPLITIATLVDKPLDCLAVLKSSSIISIKDLKNKTIGQSASGLAGVMLQTMLQTNQLNSTDVNIVNAHYDLTQALLAKKVDAVTGIMRTFEVIQMDLAGQPARIFLPEEHGVPSYSELILVVNKNKMNDARLPRFIRALQKGAVYLKQHPEETWRAFAKDHPDLNNELNHRAWMASLPYFSQEPATFNKTQWQQFALFMQKNGLIREVKPLNQYISQG
jgi:putative hydroxymethylpyrimidine transport system substrate-binding protein